MTKTETHGVSSRDSPAKFAIIGALLIVITWLVFGQTAGYDFVNFDDDTYVYANPIIASGLTLQGVAHAFSGKHSGNWHPLTTLSHMLDCQLWGLHPGGHHLTNVVLHTIAVILLFLVLQQMTGAIWRSAFVAAVFAIHPLHVESVAWISERKDVLSAVFFMLTLGAYVRYSRSPSIGRYLTMSLLFALGLLSKPMLVTVPFILLLLDYWPLGRFVSVVGTSRCDVPRKLSGQRVPTPSCEWPVVRGLVIEKIPLLALSAAAGVATLWAHEHSMARLDQSPLPWRISNGLVACLTYIGQMIWPVRLAVFYPQPEGTLPVLEIGLAIVLLLLASAGAIALRRKHPYLVTGWFWYLLMLLPVIGLVQVGAQAHADRYTYLPQIGLYILLAWAIPDICRASVSGANREGMAFHRNALQRRILAVSAGLIILALGWRAYVQTSYWRNGESLWSHAISATSGNFEAHDGLGQFLLDHGRVDEAIDQFQIVFSIAPGDPGARMNLGIALTEKGRIDEAITQLQRVVHDYPTDAKAYHNLGIALQKKGDSQSAIAAYEKALSIRSRYPSAQYSLGMALDDTGRFDEAIAHYQEAVNEEPYFADAYYLLGNDLFRRSRIDDAIAAYERALQSRPVYPEVENNIGLALLQKGRSSEAIAHWQNALAIEPDFVDALTNLGGILATSSETSIRNGPQALALAERANQLSADKNPAVLRTLAAAYAENGRFTEATVTAESGLQLANTQDNSALAKSFESDLAHYRANAPVRIALPTR